MELWRDYGMTSYNMGSSSECLDMTAQVLDIALDFNKPEVVVVDVYYVAHAIDEAWAYSFRHMFYDELPLSRRKIEAVYATQPEGGRVEFLMPFSLYHGRWDELLSGSTERIVDCEPYMMGSERRAG
ncbi:MAG: hypothetical protein Q4A66_12135, partial [Eubacteriales bacterium]|nr:hypothetical protein [Eubacteriales bacterium]